MQITKNISKGIEITDLNDIARLAKEKKSVVVMLGSNYIVRPAAFIQNWSLSQLLRTKIYYAITQELGEDLPLRRWRCLPFNLPFNRNK